MIASPNDVTNERQIIREVVHEWNDVNALVSKIMLEAVGWETHSSPELGTRAQELINVRILKNCDLLVGVFWTRVGTPTGKSISGTVEEIEEHLEAGKPAMIYFCSRPVAPDNLDPEQYQQLKEFKSKCKELGIIGTFDDTSELRSRFYKELSICLLKNPYIAELINTEVAIQLGEVDDIQRDSRRYDLSEEATKLLSTAAMSEDGIIFKVAYLSGRVVEAGGNTFGGESGREAARWEAALQQLVDSGLVIERGYKGEVFELTHEGWQLADSLKNSASISS